MSLSDTEDTGLLTGRVILGPGGGGEAETTIGELENRRSPLQYEEVEARFWERVRGKATAKASEIMGQAMAEAERLKAQAQEEGYAAGVAAAEQQIQTELAQMGRLPGQGPRIRGRRAQVPVGRLPPGFRRPAAPGRGTHHRRVPGRAPRRDPGRPARRKPRTHRRPRQT